MNLLKSLRYMNECDVQYKSSKNQRLTVELSIMKMCALHRPPEGSGNTPAEKKKQLVENVESPRQINEPTATPPVPTPVQNEIETPQPVFPQATEPTLQVPPASNAEPAAVERTVSLRSGKRFARPGSVKISEADRPVEEEIIDPTSLPQDAFSETDMQRIWQERVNLLFSEKPSLLSSLTKHKPVLKADHTIELKLDGRHQVEQLNENRSTLLEALRTELNNFSIELETPVEEGAVRKKAYTPKEIYQNMVDQNPHVEELRLKLGLDLDV
jgi:DNA polymerase-3 subunit gamma/tau